MKTLRFAAFAALALLLCACPHPNGHHIYPGGDPQPLADTPPGPVTHLEAVRDSPVRFTWIDPEGDFDYIEIWYGTSDSDKSGTFVAQVPKGTQTCTVDATPDVPLYFHFITVDAKGNRSAVVNYLVPLAVPVQVTNLTGKVTGLNSITLSWTNPADSAFDHIEITVNPGGTSGTPPKGDETYAWGGLNPGAEYTFTVKTVDKDGKTTTTEVKVTLPPAPDTTPPGPVTDVYTYGGFGSVKIDWKNPGDPDLQYVEITCAPLAGPARTVNAAPSAGGTYTWNGLAGGVLYTFTLTAVDHSGNRSAPVSVKDTPMDTTPPAAVTNLTIIPGDGYAVLTWTDPGDADLDYIQIECNDIPGPAKYVSKGVQTYTWNDPALSPDTVYTFTLKAADYTGNRSKGLSPNAGGGNVAIQTIDGTAYEIHTFTAKDTTAPGGQEPYTLTFYSPAATPAAVEVLVVAGGGGGGKGSSTGGSSGWSAGGGGAGRFVYHPAFNVQAGTDWDQAGTISVKVGAGGKGGVNSVGTAGAQGGNGGNSELVRHNNYRIIAPGGGGGATGGGTGNNGGRVGEYHADNPVDAPVRRLHRHSHQG